MGSSPAILWPILLITGGVLLGFIWMVVRVVRFRTWLLDPRRRVEAKCAHCGYDLMGVGIPRCPECGRARGFDKSFGDLGIEERDVREHVQGRGGQRERGHHDV